MGNIKTVLIYCFAVLIGLFIQGTFVRSFAPGAYAPDIILILVVSVALSSPNAAGVFGAFVLGLLADFATAQFLGPNAAGSVVAFCFVVFWSSKVFADKWIAVATLTFVASILKSTVSIVMLSFYAGINLFHFESLQVVTVEALGSALLAPIVMKILYVRSATQSRGYSFARERS